MMSFLFRAGPICRVSVASRRLFLTMSPAECETYVPTYVSRRLRGNINSLFSYFFMQIFIRSYVYC